MKLSMRINGFIDSRNRTLTGSTIGTAVRSSAVCLFLFAACLPTNAQQTSKTLSIEKTEELFELIFPRSSKEFDIVKQEFSIDVRLDPSLSVPKQLSITSFRDGRLVAHLYKLTDEKENLGDQIISLIQKGGSDDVETLAMQLGVRKTEINHPGFLRIEVNDFFRRTSFRKETRFMLDGVGYYVWYVDAGNEISLSVAGGEKFEKGESPLITWIRNLFRKLDRRQIRKPTD